MHFSKKNGPGAFEELGHFSYLFYKDIKISSYSSYSISPSDRFVIFQDGPTGDIVLFDSKSQDKRILVKYPKSLARTYKWQNDENSVLIFLENEKQIKGKISVGN